MLRFPYPLLKSYPYPVITLYVFGYGKCTEYGFRTRTSGYGGRTDLGTRSNMYMCGFSKYNFLLPTNPTLIIILYFTQMIISNSS